MYYCWKNSYVSSQGKQAVASLSCSLLHALAYAALGRCLTMPQLDLLLLCCRTTVAAAADIQQELQQQLNTGFDLDTTPLMLACKHGQAEAARTLLQHGANPQLVDRRGNNTCLHIAAFAGHTDVIKVNLLLFTQCSSSSRTVWVLWC